ncbi:MAG: hypothetical protein NC228_08860, partial [[Eubacterium] siraeum]|nr:hypothetical protein [[Eubacterium] siraeum]
MFVNTDKIGHMGSISAKDWKGPTIKEQFDQMMAEKEEQHNAERRQDILDTISGKVSSNPNRIELEVRTDYSRYVEKGYVYDTYRTRSGGGGKVVMATADIEKMKKFGIYYSNIDSFSPDENYEQNKDKYVMNDPFNFHGITKHKQNADGTYNRYLNG